MTNPNFIPIEGNWDLNEWIQENQLVYENRIYDVIDGKDPRNVAFGLFEGEMKSGTIKIKVNFLKEGSTTARIIVGYDSKTGGYYSVGIGGYKIAYLVDRFDEGIGWRAIYYKGNRAIIQREREYLIEVKIEGQRLILKIDNTKIFDVVLPTKNLGNQIGLFSWGKGNVLFKDIIIKPEKPKAFVIMKFDDAFTTIYKEIQTICNNLGLEAYNVGEVHKPSYILDDIIQSIKESEVLIADITPFKNDENIYYEIGYAHGLDKKVILLARKHTQLPFDVSGYRVIFYDDISTRGRKELSEKLLKTLKNELS